MNMMVANLILASESAQCASLKHAFACMCCPFAGDTVQKLGVRAREQRLRADLQRHALQCTTLVQDNASCQ